MNNRVFAEKDQAFIAFCDALGIKPTKRQASKFRAKKGKVYEYVKTVKDGDINSIKEVDLASAMK